MPFCVRMPFRARAPSREQARRVPVSASIRASGHDDLPDTFYVHSIPRRVKKLGVGAHLLVSVGDIKNESLYSVVLGPVRVRGNNVVEFLGFSESFLYGICYIQVPISRADVSKFRIIDVLRGLCCFSDPIPDRYVRYIRPISVALPADDEEVSGDNVEVGEEVDTRV